MEGATYVNEYGGPGRHEVTLDFQCAARNPAWKEHVDQEREEAVGGAAPVAGPNRPSKANIAPRSGAWKPPKAVDGRPKPASAAQGGERAPWTPGPQDLAKPPADTLHGDPMAFTA